MAENRWLGDTARNTVIDKNVSLADGVRAAADFNNDTELDFFAIPYLLVHWDTTAPAVDAEVAQLWILPGDNATTEIFPEGGDGAVGSDDDPQDVFLMGSFISINPSITTDETLCLPPLLITPFGSRFVLLNVSGFTFNATWELRIKPFKTQTV